MMQVVSRLYFLRNVMRHVYQYPMLVITDDWLERHSKHGAWTYHQLSAIGAPTPPVKGWKKLVIGREITDIQAHEFAIGKDIKHRKGKSIRRPISVGWKPQQPVIATTDTVKNTVREPLQSSNSRSISTDPGMTRFPGGMHRGKQIQDVPRDYLDWVLKKHAFGGEFVSDVAAFLLVKVPKKVVKYAGTTITREELDRLAATPGYTKINAFCDGIDIMGVSNCEHMHDPNADWPDKQEWDGITEPWLDQGGELDAEFRGMFG